MNNESPAGFITLRNVRNCNDMIVSVCLRLDAITSYCYDKENKKTLVFMNGEIKPWGFDGDLTGAIDKAVNEWYLAQSEVPEDSDTIQRLLVYIGELHKDQETKEEPKKACENCIYSIRYKEKDTDEVKYFCYRDDEFELVNRYTSCEHWEKRVEQ